MTATIATVRDRIHRDLRNARRVAYAASLRHDAISFGRANHLIEALERHEDALDAPSCDECRRPDCRGAYKPDGDHDLAF